MLKIVVIASAVGLMAPQAWALGGGGFAPGAPLSATVSPSCNGFNMDGTVNTSTGADRIGCVDRSANSLIGVNEAPRG